MPRFGDLEAAVMGEVWSAEHPVRVRDVLSGINKRRQLAYTTVQTVMDVLHRKAGCHAARTDGPTSTQRQRVAKTTSPDS